VVNCLTKITGPRASDAAVIDTEVRPNGLRLISARTP
jgi:hypothetical protein